MKKVMASILAFALLAGQAVFAETDTSGMENALVTVKSRIEVPADMTEFSSRTWSYAEGETMYGFQWESKDGTKNMDVTADADGNIQDVSIYDQSWYQNTDDTPRLYDFSREQAVSLAEDFLRQLVPAAFADENDRFVYDGSAGGNLASSTYSVGFVRTKDGIPVPDSTASVQIRVSAAGGEVTSCSVAWDYDAVFDSAEGLLADGTADFQQNFPLELAYRKLPADYSKNGQKGQDTIILEYTLPGAGAAYIDAKTGAVLREDTRETYKSGGSGGGAVNEAAMAQDATADRGLTPEEIQELETVAGLLSTDELTAQLKAMPELKISDTMTGVQYTLTKTEEDYIYQLTMDDEQDTEKDTVDRYLTASLNAETGEILSIYNGDRNIYVSAERNEDGTAKKLTQEEAAAYQAKAEAFINTYFGDKAAQAEKIPETGAVEYSQLSTVGVSYRRMIDGIPYPDNTIYAGWSPAADRLASYSSSWDKDVSSAPDKAGAVGVDAAYQAILARNPLEAKYILSGGAYKVAYGLSSLYTNVNAITGQVIGYDGQEIGQADPAAYTDIDGHWAQAMINALADYGVKLPGGEFMPDSQIQQKDYLMLLCGAASIYYGDQEDMYERLVSRRILTEADKAPESALTKEDALKYLLRTMGIQDVAELKGIYVCDFQDAADISEDKIGYCAIAKGFGIVSGDGGMLYPQKELTRAEAVTLLYQYLTK